MSFENYAAEDWPAQRETIEFIQTLENERHHWHTNAKKCSLAYDALFKEYSKIKDIPKYASKFGVCKEVLDFFYLIKNLDEKHGVLRDQYSSRTGVSSEDALHQLLTESQPVERFFKRHNDKYYEACEYLDQMQAASASCKQND